MNGTEHEELLYRLDERTARIEEEHLRRLSNVEEKAVELKEATESNEARIQRNETILKVITGGVSAVVAFVVAKAHALSALLRFA